MLGALAHIAHQLSLAKTGRSAENPPIEGDLQAAVPALVRTDLEQLGRDDPVEAGPIKVGEAMVKFAGDRGHDGDQVALPLDQIDNTTDRRVVQLLLFSLLHSSVSRFEADRLDLDSANRYSCRGFSRNRLRKSGQALLGAGIAAGNTFPLLFWPATPAAATDGLVVVIGA